MRWLFTPRAKVSAPPPPSVRQHQYIAVEDRHGRKAASIRVYWEGGGWSDHGRELTHEELVEESLQLDVLQSLEDRISRNRRAQGRWPEPERGRGPGRNQYGAIPANSEITICFDGPLTPYIPSPSLDRCKTEPRNLGNRIRKALSIMSWRGR